MPTAVHRFIPLLTAVLLTTGAFACGAQPGLQGEQGLQGPEGQRGPPGPSAPDGRIAVQLPGPQFYPEGMTAAADGTFYVGSIGTGAIVRSPPYALGTEPFVAGREAFGVYGMALDEAHGTLWACTYDDNLAPAQPSYLTAYSLSTGAQVASYAMPGDNGACNDVALDGAGNVYASDSFGNLIVRVRAGGNALETWSTNDAYVTEPGTFGLNGLIYDGTGGLYVVKTSTGELFHVPILADGSAGTPTSITVEPALSSPDGLEAVDANTLIVAEYDAGQVSTVKLEGTTGHKEVIANGFFRPTSVVVSEGSAWVLESQMDYLFGAPGSPELPFRIYRVALP